MEKDLIFFGKEGLTSTSANYTANVAKEYYQTIEMSIEGTQMFSKYVELISGAAQKLVRQGTTSAELQSIPQKIEEITKCKQLIAWLREAIKARENLIKEVRSCTLEKFCSMSKLEMPEYPDMASVLTEDEYYGSLGIKERNAYYALETKCAVLGKFIHPTGKFANAREELKKKLNEPISVLGTGRDATIYTFKPTVSTSEVDDLFYDMQVKYREYQANLNSIKFSCQKAIEESQTKAETEYNEALSAYNLRMRELNSQLSMWKNEQQIAIGNLKIVIPDTLKGIYSKINALGKDK